MRRLSGGTPLTLASREPQPPRSPVMSRYRVAWLQFAEGDLGPRVFQTGRIAGSGPHSDRVFEARRRLRADTDSIAMTGSVVSRYLAADGVRTVSPPLFPS